jgi:hypothetical protein
MTIVKDIRIIAKTDTLEEKIARALAQSDALTAVPGGAIPGETTNSDDTGDTTLGGPANDPPGPNGVLYTGGPLPVLSGAPPAPPNPIDPIVVGGGSGGGGSGGPGGGTGGGGTTIGLPSPVSNPGYNPPIDGVPSPVSGTPTQGGGTSTDQSNNATGGGTPGVDGGAGGAPIGGSNVLNFGQAGANDATLNGMIAAARALHASNASIQNMVDAYNAGKYGEPGAQTANQVTTQNPNAPGMGSPNAPSNDSAQSTIGFTYPLVPNTFPQTGFQVTKVQHGKNASVFPTPTTADLTAMGMTGVWTGPDIPPQFAGWQSGYFWFCTNPEGAVGETPEQCVNAACASLDIINPGGDYHNAQLVAGTLTPDLSHNPPQSWNFQWEYYSHIDFAWHQSGVVSLTRAANSGYSSYSAYYGYVAGRTPPVVAPTYTMWPQTGVNILALVGGQLLASNFDPATPFALLHTVQSVITLAAGDGVNVINPNFLQISPAIGGGTLMTTFGPDGTTVLFANYYDSNGVKQAVLSASQVVEYLPKNVFPNPA